MNLSSLAELVDVVVWRETHVPLPSIAWKAMVHIYITQCHPDAC